MVNKVYLMKENVSELKKVFRANPDLPSIKMEKFFSQEDYLKLAKKVKNASFKERVDPMHFRYKEGSFSLNSKELREFFSQVVGRKVSKVEGRLCAFGHKDYTLLHDEKQEKSGYDVIVDFTSAWDESFGGVVTYTDGEGMFQKVPCGSNTCVLVQRRKGVQKFVKYVNNLAGKKRRVFYIGRLVF